MSKKALIVLIMIVITAMIIYDGLNQKVNSHSMGADPGFAHDPAHGHGTCQSALCHAGPTPAIDTGIITTNIPAAGYSPDTTYNITATVTRAAHVRFGFEITAENPSGTNLGNLININSNTQINNLGSNYYITHTLAGTTGSNGFHTWTFNWKAPAAGSGPVTFYGSFNITNNNNSSTGDTIVVSTRIVSENTFQTSIPSISAEIKTAIYPNPCKDYATLIMPADFDNQLPIAFVYDIKGKEISLPVSINNSIAKGMNIILNTSNLTNGIYFCITKVNS